MKPTWLGVTLTLSLGLAAPLAGAQSLSPPQTMPVLLAAAKPTASSGALQTGIRYYQRGYINKALPYLEQAARQVPGNAEAFLWLARAYHKQGKPADLAKAQAAYQKVLSLQPDNLEALSNLGEMWSWDSARREEAIALLKRAHDLKPGDPAIGRKLAEALFWQGRAMDALRYASPVARHFRQDKKWMGEYAQMLSQTGHAEEALQIYETVLKDEGDRRLDIQMGQAWALLRSGKPAEAKALYQELVQRLDAQTIQKNPELIKSLGALAFDLGLMGDALKWDQSLPPALQRQKDVQLRIARELVRLYRMPEAVEGFHRLHEAGLLSAGEKLEYAEYLRQLPPEALPSPNLVETLYQEALQQAPGNGEVALRLARLYGEAEDRFEDTVAMYRQALENTASGQRLAVQKEFLDYLKSAQGQKDTIEQLFQQMLAEDPENVVTRMAYAEFLSWQGDRRPEALRMYVALAQVDPDNSALWEGRIEEVLKWHKPSTSLIPLYQEIVNAYPQNKAVWQTVARAYAHDKHYYVEAVETYGILIKRYPDDATLKREWLGLLLANESRRNENIEMLAKMVEEDPGDLDVLATYGKLLSYQRRYREALDAFEQVLAQNPEHREALVGKGYVILWSGRKLEAKDFFSDLRHRYPDDVDIAIGLAQTEKMIGRYDEAIRIIQEIKPLMQQRAPESGAAWHGQPVYRLVADERPENSLQRRAVYDFSILPYAAQPAEPASAPPVSAQPPSVPTEAKPPAIAETPEAVPQTGKVMMVRPAVLPGAAPSSELQSIQSEVNALTEAVRSLRALQQSSRHQLDRLGQSVQVTQDAVPYEMTLSPQDESHGAVASGLGVSREGSLGTEGMTPAYGVYSALDYDTNPLLSGLGRFRNDDLSDLEKGLTNDLRPMLRGGFLYSTQDGESTTSRFSYYGFPNQVSLSLTPQIRVRGGIRPTRYYIPRGISPDSTWGVEYGAGATVKYWDRLTLDGDIAITHFTQSSSENVTFQAQAQYDFTDSIRAKLGFRRLPPYNSLLSVTGIKPYRGAFSGDLVGQARENGIYAELNTHPFNHNWDWNLGYEWAFVDGEHIPTNYKNQAFTSLGYTWHYAARHQMRLGYEFLYFGYSKNTTNGFFDITARGLRDPVVSLRPVTLADSGYDFGGYYSPKWFVLNAFRLDLRGSLLNKFLEYKLGGSLGIQAFGLGHGIDEPSDASLASSFDANLIMNLTDWLAAYGNVDFLDAGGQFNRWRFGGGLIVRPHIQALSPMFGPRLAQPLPPP